VRTPMQWGDESQAGFSTGEKLVHPVIDKGDFSYKVKHCCGPFDNAER